MKRVLTTVLAVALLLGLGALAVLAMPRANAPLAAAPVVSAAAQLNPDAPAVGPTSFNAIALPLKASASISPFTASGLAAYHGDGVVQVLKWNPEIQSFDSYVPGVSPSFLDFELEVGGSYFLELDNTSGTVFSIVGDVPDPEEVFFGLTKGTSATDCAFNSLSIPLDQSGITKASELAADIGGVVQVLQWDAGIQSFSSYVPGVSGEFLDFDVRIGYPYFICVNDTGPAQWP